MISRLLIFALALVSCVNILRAQTAQEIFSATGQTQGLCLRVGTTNGSLEGDLANNGRFVVYGIALTDADKNSARKTIADRGLQAIASVERHASLTTLPLSDNMANLVVAELLAGLTEQEVMRVVAPEGAAYLKKSGAWSVIKKAQPSGFGDFAMFEANAECNLQSADETIKPSNSLRWIADYPDRDNGYSLNQGSGARTWHDKIIGVEGSVEDREASLWLKCRNAYNGRFLWRKKTLPVGTSDYDARGRALCLGNNKLFTYIADGQPLAAIDLETGNTIKSYEGGPVLDRKNCDLEFGIVLYKNGKVLQAYNKTLSVHDEVTGNLLWKKTDGPYPYVCISGENVYAIKGAYESSSYTRAQNHGASSRLSFNLSTGVQRWSAGASAGSLGGLHFYGGKLIEFQSVYKCCGATNGSIAVINPDNGSQIWKANYPELAAVGTCLFLGDRIYASSSDALTISYDLNKGTSRTETTANGVHGACKRGVSTSNYLLVNGMYFIDKNLNLTKTTLARAGCGSSVHPANGMVYAPPSGCSCYTMFHGYAAFANQASEIPFPENLRLETFALAPSKKPETTVWPAPNEWPMFMANPRRSSYTATDMSKDIRKKWSVKITTAGNGSAAWDDFNHNNEFSGILTPPTVAGGRVFVSVTHTHEIVALNANNGSELWRFTSGGRVDGPPTIYGDLCIFGNRDGWVYCLNAGTGELIWRFFAGRSNRQIMSFGQLESPWAHSGSAMVYKGNVFIIAGRHSETDRGFLTYKLDAYTGKLLWSDSVTNARVKSQGTRKGTPVNAMLRPVIFDGKLMMMSKIAVHPELNKAASVKHYLDVMAPPDHYWAEFPNVTKDQWDATKWEIGRAIDGKFNILNYGKAKGAGVGYGYRRHGYPGYMSTFNVDHFTFISGNTGKYVKVPMDSTWTPIHEAGKVPANLPVVCSYNTDEAIRAVAETPKNFVMAFKKGTENKIRVANSGTTEKSEFDLPGEPVWHGIAVAGGEAFATTNDGSVTCFGTGAVAIKPNLGSEAKILNMLMDANGFSVYLDQATEIGISLTEVNGKELISRNIVSDHLILPFNSLPQGYFIIKGRAGKNEFIKSVTITR